MNLLSGGVVSGNRLVLGDDLIPLPEHIFRRVENNQHVTLGIRHEAVTLTMSLAPSSAIQLPAEVQSTEPDYVHHTQTVHLRTGQWNYAGIGSLDESFRVGQVVRAQFDPERLYFFDTRSGLRL